MVWHVRSASSRSAAGASEATTRLTRPAARASEAESSLPAKSISAATLAVAARVTATLGVEQKSPMRTPGVAKRAPAAARTTSQEAASWQPAAKAQPWTAARTGIGQVATSCIKFEHWRNKFASYLPLAISPRSWPAPKCRPALVRSTTEASLRFSGANFSVSAWIMAPLRALRLSGLLMCRCRTRPKFVSRTSVAMARGVEGRCRRRRG
mmetsp:Transcript_70579/g.202206  ORF Transcript_70579/g.202206 Transcript_70579/m.202206 type:complete len:210 (-) Transcript_70579:27-656(-)